MMHLAKLLKKNYVGITRTLDAKRLTFFSGFPTVHVPTYVVGFKSNEALRNISHKSFIRANFVREGKQFLLSVQGKWSNPILRRQDDKLSHNSHPVTLTVTEFLEERFIVVVATFHAKTLACFSQLPTFASPCFAT
jgi:hypothetical protein